MIIPGARKNELSQLPSSLGILWQIFEFSGLVHGFGASIDVPLFL